jgi:hypothetical protein
MSKARSAPLLVQALDYWHLQLRVAFPRHLEATSWLFAGSAPDSFFFSFVAYVGYKDAWFVRSVKIQQPSSIDIIHRRYKFLGE